MNFSGPDRQKFKLSAALFAKVKTFHQGPGAALGRRGPTLGDKTVYLLFQLVKQNILITIPSYSKKVDPMTNCIGYWRDKISELWHEKINIWGSAEHSGFETADQYSAFCASKDWIQDTCDMLNAHRAKGFSSDVSLALLELLGVFQALFIQQDAIVELLYALSGRTRRRDFPDKENFPAWHEIRELRHICVGHPVRKDHNETGTKRTVFGRTYMSYQRISGITYASEEPPAAIQALGPLIDEYDKEAANLMKKAFDLLSKQIENIEQAN